MDNNTQFLTNELLREFELHQMDRASRDSSNVEEELPEEDDEAEQHNEECEG